MITAAHMRAALAQLGIDQRELAELDGISPYDSTHGGQRRRSCHVDSLTKPVAALPRRASS